MRGLWFALVCLASSAFAQSQPISISGTVLGTNGVPLRKADVILQPIQAVSNGSGTSMQPYGATSDGSGRFSLPDVAPGSYTLSAEHTGYLRANYGFKGSSFMILTLTAGQEMTDISIRMTEQSVIMGKVADEDGDPVSRMTIQLLRKVYINGRRQLGQMGSTQTNDIGEFRLSAVAAGQYYLIAEPQRVPAVTTRSAPGAVPKPEEEPVLTYYPGVREVDGAVLVKVTAGETMPGLNIRLQKAEVFHIRGTVTGEAATTGQDRVTVTHTTGVGTETFTSPIGRDGHFDVAGVPSGSWMIAAFHAQSAVQSKGSRVIEVSGRDIDDLVLNAIPPADLHGVLRFEGPAPADSGPAMLRVGLTALIGPPATLPNAAVDADGKFTLPGAGAGRYRLTVTGIPQGSYLKAVTVNGGDVLTSGLQVGEGGGAGNIEVVIGTPAAEIFGTVLGADGNNLPGSVVTLVPDPFNGDLVHLFQRVSTDQNGAFSLKGVAPGSYRVYAWGELESGAQFDPDVINTNNNGQPATVSEGDRTIATLIAMIQ